MKGRVRFAILMGISVSSMLAMAALSVSLSLALSGDTSADRVLGQYDFTRNIANLVDAKGIALSATLYPSSYDAGWVAVDTSGATHHLYASDTLNHRVLGWLNADSFANGARADLVIGQPDFLSWTANNGGLGASSLNWPLGVAVDGSGNLYVADAGNGRVLEYDNPFATCAGNFPCIGGAAKLVFGRCGSFTGNNCISGTSADTLANGVQGVAVDPTGNLFVADGANHRVLEYLAPFTGGAHSGAPGFSGDTTADAVFGQSGNFAGSICNQNSSPSADTLCSPRGVSLDPSGDLFVADSWNNRVLEYLAPFTGGAGSGTPGATGDTTADVVFGQAGSFTTSSTGTGAAGLNRPHSVVADATGDVYIADGDNLRVLEFSAPVGTTPSANMVFGQNGSFTARVCGDDDYNFNQPRPSADSLCFPRGMALDQSSGNLFVVDGGGNRILKYDNPLAGGGTPGTPGAAGDTTADGVLGQGNFSHSFPELVDGIGLGFNVGCCGPNFNAGGVAVDRHSTPTSLCCRHVQQPRAGVA